jgi:protein-disulfide isomerase
MLKRTLIPLAFTFAMLSSSYAAASTDKNALSDYFGGQLTVQKTFDVTGTNLTGHVVTYAGNPKPMIAYTHKNPDFMIIQGSMYDKNKKNITDSHLNAYLAENIKQRIHKFSSYTQGQTQNVPNLYAFVDPTCGYCIKLKKELNPIIAEHKLSVTYIPVAIRGEKGLARSTKLLQDELKIDEQQARGLVNKNTKLFTQAGLNGTPALFYFTKKQEPVVIPGYIDPTQLNTLLPEMASLQQDQTNS